MQTSTSSLSTSSSSTTSSSQSGGIPQVRMTQLFQPIDTAFLSRLSIKDRFTAQTMAERLRILNPIDVFVSKATKGLYVHRLEDFKEFFLFQQEHDNENYQINKKLLYTVNVDRKNYVLNVRGDGLSSVMSANKYWQQMALLVQAYNCAMWIRWFGESLVYDRTFSQPNEQDAKDYYDQFQSNKNTGFLESRLFGEFLKEIGSGTRRTLAIANKIRTSMLSSVEEITQRTKDQWFNVLKANFLEPIFFSDRALERSKTIEELALPNHLPFTVPAGLLPLPGKPPEGDNGDDRNTTLLKEQVKVVLKETLNWLRSRNPTNTQKKAEMIEEMIGAFLMTPEQLQKSYPKVPGKNKSSELTYVLSQRLKLWVLHRYFAIIPLDVLFAKNTPYTRTTHVRGYMNAIAKFMRDYYKANLNEQIKTETPDKRVANVRFMPNYYDGDNENNIKSRPNYEVLERTYYQIFKNPPEEIPTISTISYTQGAAAAASSSDTNAADQEALFDDAVNNPFLFGAGQGFDGTEQENDWSTWLRSPGSPEIRSESMISSRFLSAAKYGDAKFVQAALDNSSLHQKRQLLSVTNAKGDTAMDYAIRYKHHEVARLLKQ